MEDEELVRQAANACYASGAEIWSPSDRWNEVKRRGIEAFAIEVLKDLRSDARVLNAGSGSHKYEWMPPQAVNLDRFAAQVMQLPNPVVGDLEDLPFGAEEFDAVICVGSVLNYTSAMEAIAELSRVLKPGAALVLHFEASDSAEHLGTSIWRAPAAPLQTMNNGRPDLVWVYSRSFIRRALKRYSIEIERQQGFHIASAALLRLGISQQAAAGAAYLDRFFAAFSFLADDFILMGRKSSG